MATRTLTAVFDADTRALANATRGAEKTGGNFASRFLKGVGKAAAIGGGIVGSLLSAKALKGGYDRLVDLEDATARLTITMGDAQEASAFLQEISDFSFDTTFGTDQLSGAAADLVSFGVESNKVVGYLEAIGEAAATQGSRSEESFDRISTSFGRMASSGKISMEDINTLADTGVNALAILGNEFDVSASEMRKMISSGTVPASQAMDILSEGIVEGSEGAAGAIAGLGGTMEGLRGTMSGNASRIGSAMDRLGANVIGPFTDDIAEGFGLAADVISGWGAEAGETMQRFADSSAWETIRTKLRQIPDWIGAGFATIGGARDAIVDFFETAQGMDLKNDTFTTFANIWDRLKETWEGIKQPLADILASLGEASTAIGISTWQILLDTVEGLVEAFGPLLEDILGGLADWMKENQGMVTAIMAIVVAWKALNLVMNLSPIMRIVALGLLLIANWDKVKAAANTLKDIVAAAWSRIWGAIKTAWDFIWNTVLIPWRLQFELAWKAAQTLRDIAVGAWNRLRDGLHAAWTFIKTKAIDPLAARFEWLWGKAKDIAEKISGVFVGMKDAIGEAFGGIVESIKGAISTVFAWINKHVIGNINKVLGVFDVKIGELPAFHRGGYVTGRGEQAAVLLGGEGVLNPRATRAVGGKGGIDRINRGQWPAMGGWFDGAVDFVKGAGKSIIDGVMNVGGKIGGWLKKGFVNAAVKIFEGVTSGVRSVVPAGFVRDLAGGWMSSLADAFKSWAEGKDSDLDKQVPDSPPGSGTHPGDISTKGWAKPIGNPYRFVRGSAGHGYLAVDLGAPTGVPIYSAADGVVTKVARLTTSYGKHAFVAHPGTTGVYAHMSQIMTKLGDQVRAGQQIGKVGSTGNSTGPHLHFETRGYDPVNFMRARGIKFDQGGWLPPGRTLAINNTGGPERVLSPSESRGNPIEVRVYVGDREITDIVRTEVREHDQAGVRRLYQAGVHA